MKLLPTIALGWAGSLFLAFLYLRIGTAIEMWDVGVGLGSTDYLVFAGCIVGAGTCAWAVPALGARNQAGTEARLRQEVEGHVFPWALRNELGSERAEWCRVQPTALSESLPTVPLFWVR